MAEWAFIVQDRSGNAYADLAPYLRDRHIQLLLNKPGEVTGRINLGAKPVNLSWLQAGVHELKILRNMKQVGGLFRLTDVDVSLGKQTAELSLRWEGIQTYLRELLIPAGHVETGVAQSLHAWNLINTVQALPGASVYNFTRGVVPSTDPTKDRTYTDPVDCLTAIEALSGRNAGFDFEFNSARQFDCFYPYRGTDNGVVLEWQKGAHEIGYTIAAGPGSVGSDLVVVDNAGHIGTSTDANARSTYGRRDMRVVLSDLNESNAVMQSYSDAFLTVMKSPVFVPTVVIDPTVIGWGSYGLGDTVHVRAKYGDGSYVNFNSSQRIVGIGISISSTNAESIALELNDTLPIVVERETILRTRRLKSPSATNGLVSPTLEQRVAMLERFVS